MQQGIHAVDTRPARVRPPRTGAARPSRRLAAALVVVAVAVAIGGLIAVSKSPLVRSGLAVRTRAGLAATTIVSGSPAAMSAGAARALLSAAPAVVIANSADRTDVVEAAAVAVRGHAPLLLATVPSTAAEQAALRAGLRSLGATAVMTVGIPHAGLAAALTGDKVVTTAGGLPLVTAAAPLRHVAVLVHGSTSVTAIAAAATAAVAGAEVIALKHGYDPRASPAAIEALAAARPASVVAVGTRFRSVRVLAARLAVAETGVQLPGGGQLLFPLHRLVALYGSPESAALGALGQQDLPASITRAKAVAAQYRTLSKVPVVPAFEIIATVAQGSPGPSGTYSYVTPVPLIRRYIQAATAAHMYVILDLQPGRASLLTQAKVYRSVLKLPDVGLALDPEWKLQPGQRPLQQIGSVSITEVNSVVNWLAALTARYHLPQKLLELHQFQLSMIQDEAALNTRHDDLAIVINMDGQGAPQTKQQTWDGITSAAPRGVFFGWKDFYVKDTPMLDPQATIAHKPAPVLISYQ